MRISIIGLGLIGGSWGLALKSWAKTEEGKQAQLEIIGFDAKGARRGEAQKMGVADKFVSTPMEAAKNADIVIIATPVMAIRETFEDIAEYLSPNAIVTDTASTKRDVMRWAKQLLPTTVNFIGGHPMAGRTGSLEEASPELFRNAIYCLTPLPNVKEEALATLVPLIEVLGAGPHFIDPDEHDSYVAAISHLPFLTSAALMNLASSSDGWNEISQLAATGFQDVTRLAGGSVDMHLDICRTNNDAIIGWLDRYQRNLSQLRAMLVQAGLHDEMGRPKTESEGDDTELKKYLEQAKTKREAWIDQKRTKPIPTDYEYNTMPNKNEMGMGVNQMLFGGLFKKKPVDGDNNGRNNNNNSRR